MQYATAVRDECPLPGELLETLLEVVDGHRQRARDVPGGVLPPPAACPGRRRRRTGRGGAAPFQSLSPALHETRRPQRLQVLGYVGDGEGGLLGERVDGPFALGEELEDLQAAGASERFAEPRELRVEALLEQPITDHIHAEVMVGDVGSPGRRQCSSFAPPTLPASSTAQAVPSLTRLS